MNIEESGHTDVASAKNQVKVAMSALEKMRTELGKLGDEGSLPSWWTNKVAIAVDKLDGMADYLDTQVEENKMEEKNELDEKIKWKMGDGRPRGSSHIENERFWDLPKDSLEYIIKDAGEAMKANPTARKATTGRGNWADQVNDASTVLGWRKKNGIKEEVNESVQRVANAISFHEAGKMSPAARAKQDALRDIGKDNSKDDDEVTATDADRAKADRNIITRFKKIADVSKEFSQKGKFATQYIKRIDPKTGNPEKERSGVTRPGTLKTYKIKFDQGPEKSVDLEDIKLVLALWDSGKLNSSLKLQLQKKMEKSYEDFKSAIDMLKKVLKTLVSKGR
jgi:hypothetical protein